MSGTIHRSERHAVRQLPVDGVFIASFSPAVNRRTDVRVQSAFEISKKHHQEPSSLKSGDVPATVPTGFRIKTTIAKVGY